MTAALLVLAIAAHAADRCPWINAATASGPLGGEVTAQVTRSATNNEDAACTFEMHRGEVLTRLAIDVTTMPSVQPPRCAGPAVALKAIGNEAVACAGTDRHERWEMVAGRVRDRAFTVRLSTNDAGIQTADLREKARAIAEQVAGILF